MSIFEHWQVQREALKPVLEAQTDLSSTVYQIRHALVQTEQNALAEMEDDVIRQQAGILMGCVKNSLSLCEVNVVHQTWVAQKAQASGFSDQKPWPLIALIALQAAMLLLGYFQEQWAYVFITLAVSILGIMVYRNPPTKSGDIPKNEMVVTVRPDTEKLLCELDKQIRLVDRSLNDFRYLNEQTGAVTESADEVSVSKAAGLIEAIWECDAESRGPAEEAAQALLRRLGLTVAGYDGKNRGYFNVLPGKKQTRTLSPALLSAEDGHLLRRGTAVVCEADIESL